MWSTQTSGEHRPSLKKAAGDGAAKTIPATTIPLRKEKVRLAVKCSECMKPRCVFPKSRLTRGCIRQLELCLWCTITPPPPPSHALYRVAVVRDGLTCSSEVSSVYFSSKWFPDVCYVCGLTEPTEVPAAVKAQCQVANPACAACAASGKSVRSRKRAAKRKHADTEDA